MATIANELQVLKESFKTNLEFESLRHLFCMDSLLPWPVVAFALICSSSICAISFISSPFWKTDLTVGILLLLIILLNICLVVWIHTRKKNEIVNRITFLIQLFKDVQLDECTKDYMKWMETTKDSTLSVSPSYSFSMVYLKTNEDPPVAFPTTLLQTGSIIEIGAGQVSPCQVTCAFDGCISLEKGEMLSKDKFTDEHVQASTSAENFCRFRVTRSPICEELSRYWDNSSTVPSLFNRPKSMLVKNREKSMLALVCAALPVISVLALVVITCWVLLKPIKYCMSDEESESVFSFFMEYDNSNFWFDLYVLSLVLIVLPLLPIFGPVLWMILYFNGEAKTLLQCFRNPDKTTYKSKTGLVSPTVHSLDEILSSSGEMNDHSAWFNLLLKLLRGKKDFYVLNAGLFDHLGSVTALCCIDKKGILSWYDPMPEKISFLCDFQDEIGGNDDGDNLDEPEEHQIREQSFAVSSQPEGQLSNVKLEIMNISHDRDNMKLQFDDHDWQHLIGSLKPIGLNILLTHLLHTGKENIAASDDCEHLYARKLIEDIKKSSFKSTEKQRSFEKVFSHHCRQLHLIAAEMDCTFPDIDRLAHGLQSLSQLIGFADDVTLLYSPKMVVTGYKKVVSYVARKKPLSCLQPENVAATNKYSLEYIHSVVVSSWLDKENHYLMSIGGGDMLTSCCSHYWDGAGVKILDETQRKKILDFTHRNSITGCCVSFAFRPVDLNFVKRGNSMTNIDDEESESQIPSNQIFLGMAALQYQPRVDIIRLIEALDGASIRFVHFTPEDEFKARVFAEKMGLEVGWNCHISLAPATSSHQEASTWQDSTHTESDNPEDNDEATSALLSKSPQTPLSDSSFSDSAFYQQNRAKLPRGIENIIPHIEQVDNVPLLVPLFTDSDQKCMREMISIMQRYGEVVCCIGSCESIDNIQVFAQADLSIAIQPVTSQHLGNTPLQCPLHESFVFPSQLSFNPTQRKETLEDSDFGSTQIMKLARSLNTFPCAVTLSGDNSISILYSMIKQARHALFLSTICLIFLIKSQAMISLIQLLTHLLNLPRIFSPLDVVWCSFVITPVLSFSFLASPFDSDLMTWASLKNMSKQSSKWGEVITNVKRFSVKFLPSCVIVAILYLFSLLSICEQLNIFKNDARFNSSNISIRCYPCFQISSNPTVSNSNKELMQDYVFKQRLISQQLSLCAFVFYLCVISSGYVHRWKSILSKSPTLNKVWILASVIILLIQAVYSSVIITAYEATTNVNPPFLSDLFYKTLVFTLFFVWPFPLLIINEVAKTREIKVWNRGQKRARLAFGTKLGMNSPF